MLQRCASQMPAWALGCCALAWLRCLPPPPPLTCPCGCPTRSPACSALLAEGMHSIADVANQLLLKHGVIRSRRKPTLQHQYGFHKEKYVYALISGGRSL